MISWALVQHFKEAHICDQDPVTAALLQNNLVELCKINNREEIPHIEVQEAKAEDFIQTMPGIDVVLIDPQRRDDARKGLYKLGDCSPNIHDLLPALFEEGGDGAA